MARLPMKKTDTRRLGAVYISDEVNAILNRIEAETEDSSLTKCIQFSPTALTFVKNILQNGGSIVMDTELAYEDVDPLLLEGTKAKLCCYIDDPKVEDVAVLRHVTRAEIAADVALSQQGPKLIVVSSAPAMLARILYRRQHEPLTDVCVLAAPNGFASVVQLKEKLHDSDMANIVVRGKKGGPAATVSILNALIKSAKASAI